MDGGTMCQTVRLDPCRDSFLREPTCKQAAGYFVCFCNQIGVPSCFGPGTLYKICSVPLRAEPDRIPKSTMGQFTLLYGHLIGPRSEYTECQHLVCAYTAYTELIGEIPENDMMSSPRAEPPLISIVLRMNAKLTLPPLFANPTPFLDGRSLWAAAFSHDTAWTACPTHFLSS